MTLPTLSKTFAVALVAAASLWLDGCAMWPAMGGASGQGLGGRGGAVTVAFSDRDRELISQYYGGPSQHPIPRRPPPPGLAKRDRLPPGLDKPLQKNGQLPPGLQGRGLPGDLETRLSPLPAGYARMVIGSDIVLGNTRTNVVVDILRGVAPY